MRRKPVLTAIACATLALASCNSTSTPEQLTVAAYNFPQNQIIASLYADVLANAGIQVERRFDYTSQELLKGDFSTGATDVVPEYLGSVTEFVNATANGEDATPVATGDSGATLAALEELTEPYAVTIGQLAPGSDQLQFAVTQEFAQANSLTKLSDLAALNGQIVLGGPPNCPAMDACLLGLQETYGLQVASFVPLDVAGPNTLNSLVAGSINVGMVLATDPLVQQRGLVVLQDDKNLQVAGNITPLVADSAASDEVMDLIADVNSRLTTDELRSLTGKVTVEGYPAAFVAAQWAAAQGLIPPEAVGETPVPVPPPSPTPTPTPTPEPEPEPAPAPAAPAPAAPAAGGGGGYDRNMGEPSSAAQSQNWPALAECESGGDPNIVSSNGMYHGLYQFSAQTWQSMGGSGVASNASSDEQTYRAMSLWDAAGPGQWPVCGSRL